MRPCRYCHEPMKPGQHLDLDHETDNLGRRTGRYNGLVHARCNRGVAAAAVRAKRDDAAGRSRAEQAEHDHRVAVRQRREARLAFAALEQEQVGRAW